MIGHLYFKQIEPNEYFTWELGFIFNPKYCNLGYATEASRAIVKYGFEKYHAHKIVAYCNPKNIVVLNKGFNLNEIHTNTKTVFYYFNCRIL